MGGYLDVKRSTKGESLSLTTGCTNLHVGKGRRIVISDAITENGTVPGALWIYKAVSKKSTGKGQTENKKKGGSSSSSKVSVENKDNDDNQGDSGLGIEQDYHDEIDQTLFGFIKPCLKSLLEKGKLKTRKRVAVLLPPRYLSKTKITMTIKEIQDLELNRTITTKWTMKNIKTTLRPKFVRTYPKILLL